MPAKRTAFALHALISLCLNVTALSATAELARSDTDAPQIGLNFIRFYWSEARDGQLDTATPYLQPDWIFRDFTDLGVQAFRQFVKADLLWDIIEPQNDQWNWQAADSVLKNPGSCPIVTLFRMQYASPTPPWATGPAQFQKRMGTDALNYLETVVKRYASYVKYWELGNEMDHWRAADPNDLGPAGEKLPASYPTDGYSPHDQGVFLAEAAAIIREHDPDAVILMPGMSGPDDYCTRTWLPGVIDGGGKDWFDIVNYHYYSSWERFTLLRPQLQTALEQLGISGKPVWSTETGATSSPTLTVRTNYPNSLESQAADVFRRIVQAYGHGDTFVAWHTYTSSSEAQGDWRAYGLRTETAQAKPACHSFKLLTSELIPFGRVERLSADARGVNAYRILTKTGEVKYVVWGRGNYIVPTGIIQMTTVVPRIDGTYLWQTAWPGSIVTLSSTPTILK
jgi:hypothetical protein